MSHPIIYSLHYNTLTVLCLASTSSQNGAHAIPVTLWPILSSQLTRKEIKGQKNHSSSRTSCHWVRKRTWVRDSKNPASEKNLERGSVPPLMGPMLRCEVGPSCWEKHWPRKSCYGGLYHIRFNIYNPFLFPEGNPSNKWNKTSKEIQSR